MNLDTLKEEDWRPWELAETASFKDGDIFMLSLYGSTANCTSIYRAKGNLGVNRELKMEAFGKGIWHPGHAWDMNGRTKVRFLKSQSFSIIADPQGCKCAICKVANEFAAPNQSDGSYICYECR